MDTEQTTTHDQERPPLGSDEAIGKIAEAILDFGRNDPNGLRYIREEEFPFRLRNRGYLGFRPHYLEVAEALRELPEDTDVRTTPEDMFQEYVAGVRRREMEQRRKLAARRRQDAEKLGLSAEESDRAEERREELFSELWRLYNPFVGNIPPPVPADWQPDEATLAEGRRRWLRYIDRRIRWHHQRPDIHRPLRSHDGHKKMREFAWDAECERRAAKIEEQLRALGCEDVSLI